MQNEAITAMFTNLHELAHALGGEVSGGEVRAPGPGHSAADRSLHVKLDEKLPDGFLICSFAGDDAIECRDHVRAKAGLPAFEFGSRRGSKVSRAANNRFAGTRLATFRETKPVGVVATYDYQGADGKLLYQVLRYSPKDFRQRRPNGNGGWVWQLNERRVLYRWPELLKFPDATIFITEGEKDSDRVADLGHCATTVAAGKWTDDCVAALRGRDVVILEDNDTAGRAKALTAANALNGVANSIRIVSLPNLPDKGDVSDWLDADASCADRFVDVCMGTPQWTPDVVSAASPKTPLPFINIGAWQNEPVPEREWTVKVRLPRSNVTLLSGEGAIGKSILSLHLSAAVVLGRDWLGTMPDPGPAIVVCCEDDPNELWRRCDLIFSHYGAAFAEFKNLHLLALAGEETLMAVPDRSGIIQPTSLLGRIREAACDIRPKLIVLDNAADIFGGNENDRAQVRQFIGILRGVAIAAGAGILLTSHPSLTGISSGTGLSGSTAWNASVRSRLYFKRAKTDKDEEPEPDLRVLEVMKANYGPVGETINLRWNNGLFLPVHGVSNLDKLAAERRSDDMFVKLLDQFTRQGRNTSEKPSAPTYAPTLFAKENEARACGIRKADFERSMRNHFGTGKIYLEPYGPPSRGTSRLALRA
jgi:RecA-family ATPase